MYNLTIYIYRTRVGIQRFRLIFGETLSVYKKNPCNTLDTLLHKLYKHLRPTSVKIHLKTMLQWRRRRQYSRGVYYRGVIVGYVFISTCLL